eukprot:1195562-Prorocentrum_minimum.AAC.2
MSLKWVRKWVRFRQWGGGCGSDVNHSDFQKMFKRSYPSCQGVLGVFAPCECVTFDASAEETKGAMVNMSECSSSTMVFEHQPGCRVCKGMFEHYTMPDGRTVHLFERPQEV